MPSVPPHSASPSNPPPLTPLRRPQPRRSNLSQSELKNIALGQTNAPNPTPPPLIPLDPLPSIPQTPLSSPATFSPGQIVGLIAAGLLILGGLVFFLLSAPAPASSITYPTPITTAIPTPLPPTPTPSPLPTPTPTPLPTPVPTPTPEPTPSPTPLPTPTPPPTPTSTATSTPITTPPPTVAPALA